MLEKKHEEAKKAPENPFGLGAMPPMGMPGMGMPGMGMPGMPGMPGMGMPGMGMPGMLGGPEGMDNPFGNPEMTEEDVVKYEMVSQLYQKLMDGSASAEFISSAKEILGEEEVNTAIKQYESMPEEEKKQAIEYQKMYAAMAGNFEEALKAQGVDMTNPNLDPEAFTKGMAGMFQKMMEENKDKPEFQTALNTLGENLYNKELLYPPLKKLAELYPKWLETNKGKVEEKEYARFQSQYELLVKICAAFDDKDKNVAGLIEMINKLTNYGKPPEEIAKEITMPDLQGLLPGIKGPD